MRMKFTKLFPLVLMSIGICSCGHDEDPNSWSMPAQLDFELVRLNIGDKTYVLSADVRYGGYTTDDKSAPAKISLYTKESGDEPVRTVTTSGSRHDAEEFYHHAYSESGNIVKSGEHIIYCDQWKRFESDDEKNILIVYDLDLNEVNRVYIPQSGVLRESNGRFIIMNDNLDYTILDGNLNILQSSQFQYRRDEVKQFFSYNLGAALPLYYFDGEADIVSLVTRRIDYAEYIGYIINLTSGKIDPIVWNFSEWGHWYPSYSNEGFECEFESLPYESIGYNWAGIRPYFDYETNKFVYFCMAYGEDGIPDRIDLRNRGKESLAYISLTGEISLKDYK